MLPTLELALSSTRAYPQRRIAIGTKENPIAVVLGPSPKEHSVQVIFANPHEDNLRRIVVIDSRLTKLFAEGHSVFSWLNYASADIPQLSPLITRLSTGLYPVPAESAHA